MMLPAKSVAKTLSPHKTTYTDLWYFRWRRKYRLSYHSIHSKAFPLSSYTKLKVKCTSTQVLDRVRARYRAKGFAASSISETIDQANKVFSAIQIVLMVFGMIALIVSAIGMFNTMTIALLERTEEIGIMKAIGASRGSISLMFVMESTLMGFLGAVGGVILGMIEGEILNFFINLDCHSVWW
jgi:ABC-type antimicrobial peptide transport system permease subunit